MLVKSITNFFIYLFVKFACSLRYKITADFSKVKPSSNHSLGTIFLANHVAAIDPVLMVITIWNKCKLRPVAVDYLFADPASKFLLSRVNGIAIPDFTFKRKENIILYDECLNKILTALKNKEDILIFPSGRLSTDGLEDLREQSLFASIIEDMPSINVIFVRSIGLWGSSFSKFSTGKMPNLRNTILRGIKIILRNMIFFVPKRKITVQLESINNIDLINKEKLELNLFIAKWFNNGNSSQDVLNIVATNM